MIVIKIIVGLYLITCVAYFHFLLNSGVIKEIKEKFIDENYPEWILKIAFYFSIIIIFIKGPITYIQVKYKTYIAMKKYNALCMNLGQKFIELQPEFLKVIENFSLKEIKNMSIKIEDPEEELENDEEE
jgi:hypothetical protein